MLSVILAVRLSVALVNCVKSVELEYINTPSSVVILLFSLQTLRLNSDRLKQMRYMAE